MIHEEIFQELVKLDFSENLMREDFLYFKVSLTDSFLLLSKQHCQDPAELLGLFKKLEDENLFLIQKCQQVGQIKFSQD